MKTIWKFPLQITDRQPVVIPVGAKPLTVQLQGDKPCLWALVDPGKAMRRTTIVIAIYGTGHPIEEGPGEYISTFQADQFVLHAFNMGVQR